MEHIRERRANSKSPFFEVRFNRKGEVIREVFPYIPGRNAPPDQDRKAALLRAQTYASQEREAFHIYDTKRSFVGDKLSLRVLIEIFISEALEERRPDGTLEYASAAQTASTLRNAIRQSDAQAARLKQTPMMDLPVETLTLQDFNDKTKGLLSSLRGTRRLTTEEKLERAALKKAGKPLPVLEPPPASSDTKRRVMAYLGMVWTYGVAHRNLSPKRPWEGLKIKSDGRESPARTLRPQEYEKIEAAMSHLSTTTLAAIEFLRWTAARSGEMRALNWNCFTWPTPENGLAHPEVTFRRTKSPKRGAPRTRTIQVIPPAVDALRRMVDPWFDAEHRADPEVRAAMLADLKHREVPRQDHPAWPTEGIVFPAPTKPTQNVSHSVVYQAFTRAVRRAGLPHARVHDLRHHRTTEISSTLLPGQAMAITGHKVLATFMRYTHLDPSVGDRLVAAWQKQSGPAAPILPDDLAGMVEELAKSLPSEQRMALAAKLLQPVHS